MSGHPAAAPPAKVRPWGSCCGIWGTCPGLLGAAVPLTAQQADWCWSGRGGLSLCQRPGASGKSRPTPREGEGPRLEDRPAPTHTSPLGTCTESHTQGLPWVDSPALFGVPRAVSGQVPILCSESVDTEVLVEHGSLVPVPCPGLLTVPLFS